MDFAGAVLQRVTTENRIMQFKKATKWFLHLRRLPNSEETRPDNTISQKWHFQLKQNQKKTAPSVATDSNNEKLVSEAILKQFKEVLLLHKNLIYIQHFSISIYIYV